MANIFRALKVLRMRRDMSMRALTFQMKHREIINLLGFFLIVLLFLHFSSCLWYFVARINNFDHRTWVFRKGLLDESEHHLYLVAFYWSLTTLTTVGYGDV
jgi:hypothetical protein